MSRRGSETEEGVEMRWIPTAPKRRAAPILEIGIALLAAILLVTASAGASEGFAQATLHNPAGDAVGTVRLHVSGGDRVQVTVSAEGLSPGFHGFHIHAVGDCGVGNPATPFLSAGGHFNPGGATHPSHAGDQPVLLVNADGTASAQFETDRFEVSGLLDENGSSIIVHALPDNYANVTRYGTPDVTTLATGDAGGRVACGVVGAAP